MSENTRITVGEIFELLRNGQRHDGIALLYQYHYNKMYGVAFSIVKKEDVSQDVVHNVVYKLLRLETDKFPISNELTWLYTVVKNETLMFLRKDKPKLPLDDVLAEPIVEERDIHDKEIAKMLGKPIGTVQWLYNTSVKKLKITLSTLLFAILLSGIGAIERLVNYVLQINAMPEIPGQTVRIPFDYSIVAFAVLFVALSVIFWLIFKKLHKLPTKADRKKHLNSRKTI